MSAPLFTNGINMEKMIITFDGSKLTSLLGSVGSITWRNPDAMAGLRRMFAATAKEKIVAIEVTANGIAAKFETV